MVKFHWFICVCEDIQQMVKLHFHRLICVCEDIQGMEDIIYCKITFSIVFVKTSRMCLRGHPRNGKITHFLKGIVLDLYPYSIV